MTEEWLAQFSKFLKVNLEDPDQVQRTARSVLELNRLFTGQVKHKGSPVLGTYGEQHEFRSGYTLYYLLSNLPKMRYILENTPGKLWQSEDILDVGTGPGTVLIACLLSKLHHQNTYRSKIIFPPN